MGLGDILISPFILSWPGHSLSHHAYLSRFAVLATLPTGQYSASRSVNIGSNEYGVTAYYAFTIFLQPKWETSWRLHYLYNADDNDPFASLRSSSAQRGQAFHLNYATSYELSSHLRLGINGYFLQQLTEHRLNRNAIAHSKERVVAVGPALLLSERGWIVFANFDGEIEARNRPEGYRLNLTFRKIFPARSPHPTGVVAPEAEIPHGAV